MDRSTFLYGTVSLAAATALPNPPLAAIEVKYGGRLGVMAVNSRTGARLAHRAAERFPMCSTFKMLLVAAVLARVDAGKERLDRHVRYGKADLLPYAPITQKNIGNGFMTVRALCQAAVEYSDNTAADLLLASIGGPAAYTSYARSIGDSVTRLDRSEPELNTAIPGDPRDTTTPAAMAVDLQTLLTGSALAPPSRHDLTSWMMACKTGTDRLRAGVPPSWRVADKTGTGDNGTSNDIGALYPPNGGEPIFVTAYYTGSLASSDARNHVIAEVGRIASKI